MMHAPTGFQDSVGSGYSSHCSETCIIMCMGSSFSLNEKVAIGSLAISSTVANSEANKGNEAEAGASGARLVWLIT